MDDAKQQLVDKLKTASNILVTVSRNPSVDQLSSCIGLALLLNKQGKHTAAVFSGEVPSTIEFLKPEETLEKNTDSLRDFIIALDKSKADKLRYKVEDQVVRIFITPYKTSLSERDLEFSQGDFNVDLVVALGVAVQEDLDEAITAHGRILHDATVACVNITPDGGLGSINWNDSTASSLSELVTELAQALNPNLLDAQIATALLTGIVSETERFGNDKTSPQTMSISAALMSAGANQQLVASKLDEAEQGVSLRDSPAGTDDNGTIDIDHGQVENAGPDPDLKPEVEQSSPPDDENLPDESVTTVDPALEETSLSPGPKLVTEPPTLSGTLTANSQQQQLDPVTDPLSLPNAEPPQLLERKPDSMPDFTPPPANDQTDIPSLSELEERVQATEDDARDEVSHALNSAEDTAPPKPIDALNAQPLGEDLHPEAGPQFPSNVATPTMPIDPSQPPSAYVPSTDPVNPTPAPPADPVQTDTSAPPPVPPPIPFQFGNPPQQNQ